MLVDSYYIYLNFQIDHCIYTTSYNP